MTGDRTLIAKLRSVWCTAYNLDSDEHSDLIKVMTRSFRSAAIPFAALDLTTPPLLHKIRWLYLHGGKPGIDINDYFDRPVDLSSLASLESLVVGYPYVVKSPVKLPQSLTSLHIGHVACREPVQDMVGMPNLALISFVVGPADDDDDVVNAGLINMTEWPPSLASLFINLDHADDKFFQCLPSTLKHIGLTRVVGSRDFDLATITRVLPNLTSINVGDDIVTISEPLPATLASLELHWLSVKKECTLTKTFGLFPASLTKLHISCLVYTSNLQEREGAFMSIMPRLCLRSLEETLNCGFSTAKNIARSPSFLAAFAEEMSRRGLNAHCVKATIDDAGRVMSKLYGLDRIVRLIDIDGVDDDMIRRSIDGRSLTNGKIDELTHGPYGARYADIGGRLLERGYNGSFNLAKALCDSVTDPFGGKLSGRALANLKSLIISPDKSDQLDTFLSLNNFPSLASIHICSIGKQEVDTVLKVICRNAKKLPLLERIYFEDQRYRIRIGEDVRRSLHETLKLYVKRKGIACLSYFVGRDKPSASGKI
jgi:hypothetical protein